MGAALGFLVGAASNAAGGFAQAKMQKQQQHDQLLLQTYQQHPEFADTPEAQGFLKKKFGPDVAEMFMHIGTATKQMQGEVGSAMGGGGGSPPGGTPAQGAPSAPAQGQIAQASTGAAPQGDDFSGHISTLDGEINRLRGIQTKYATNPEFGKYAPVLEKHIDELQKQRDALTTQRYSEERETQRETAMAGRQDKSIEASEERQDKSIAASEKRTEESQAGMESRLEKSLAERDKTKKEVDPAVEHKKQVDLAAATDKLFQSNASKPSFAGMRPEAALKWQIARAKAFKKAGADPSLIGWQHGSSKSQGSGWITEDGAFVPDKEVGG